MTWGRMAAVLQLSGLRHHLCRLQWPLQGRLAASFAAAGLFGGEFLASAGPLQGRYTHPPFNGAAVVEYALCYLQVLPFLF